MEEKSIAIVLVNDVSLHEYTENSKDENNIQHLPFIVNNM